MVPPPPPPGPLQSRLLTTQPRMRHRLPARLPPGYSGAIRRPARGCGGRAAGSGLPRPASVPAGSHGARAPSLFVHAHQPLQQPMPGRSRAAFQNGRDTPLRSPLPTYLPRTSPASRPTSASRCPAVQGPNSKQACAGVAGSEAPIPRPHPRLISSRFPCPSAGRGAEEPAVSLATGCCCSFSFFVFLSLCLSLGRGGGYRKSGCGRGFPRTAGESRISIRTLSYQSVSRSVCLSHRLTDTPRVGPRTLNNGWNLENCLCLRLFVSVIYANMGRGSLHMQIKRAGLVSEPGFG